MRTGYLPQAVQLAEQPYLARGVPLMARAAFGLAHKCIELLKSAHAGGARRPLAGKRVAILVGPGNNGADCLFAALNLAKNPLSITVYLTRGLAQRSDTQRRALKALAHTQVRVVDISSFTDQTAAELGASLTKYDLVLDGLLGLGSTGAVRGLMGQVLTGFNRGLAAAQAGPLCVAADLPTGVDGATGQVSDADSTFHAHHTVTFGAYKTGTLVGPGALASGQVHLVDIGIGPELDRAPRAATVQVLDRTDLVEHGIVGLPALSNHKFTAGVLGLVTGSGQYPGAGVLSAGAAVHSGAGLVRAYGDPDLIAKVTAQHPEVVGAADIKASTRVDAWVVGSGVPVLPASGQLLRVKTVLETKHVATVVDAGGLEILPVTHSGFGPHHVLTPHAGELARLLGLLGYPEVCRGDVDADPLHHATWVQSLTGAIVVLKGPVTIIAGPTAVYAQRNGTPRLATAGSGDVLAGLMGSLIAQHQARVKDLTLLAAAAVLLHGTAGRIAAGESSPGRSQPITASQLASNLPQALRSSPHAACGYGDCQCPVQ